MFTQKKKKVLVKGCFRLLFLGLNFVQQFVFHLCYIIKKGLTLKKVYQLSIQSLKVTLRDVENLILTN